MERHTDPRRLKGALAIRSVDFFAELIAGFLTNSLALLSDAGHMLSDVGAMTLSLFAFRMARRPATHQSTYGFHRVEILAALFNGGPWNSPPTQVYCGEPPPPPVTPPAPGPAPAPAVTSPTPPALVPPGGVKPRPTGSKPKPQRPRGITCAFFKRTHPTAGPKAYAKLGLRYYVCNVPVAKRTMPPVTG